MQRPYPHTVAPWGRADKHFKWQGRLLSFTVSGAMAVALSSCDNKSNLGPVMVAPPNGFSPNQAVYLSNTNSAPMSQFVYSPTGGGGYLGAHGYYPIYGYPNYYDRPAPGSTVEFVTGGSTAYTASSPDAARDDVARGGFGESGGGEGEGGHGGGEGGFGGGE
jgi:hypothetical protein